MGDLWREPARKKQWPKVLRAVRADLTQYTIYHRTNTVPIMRRLPPEQIEILQIDIDALNELVERLCAIYAQLGRLTEFPQVIERLRTNVDDPRWHRKLTYQQAMTAHLLDNNTGARSSLAKLGSITPEESDLEILQLHIDINGETIALIDKLKMFDRILGLTDSRCCRFQYSAAKAIELILAGDNAGAIVTTDAALRIGRESESQDAFDLNEDLWFCKLLEVAGIVRSDRECFIESAGRLRTLVERTEHFTPAGVGHVYRCLGDVLRLSGHWEESALAYASGFALDSDPANQIFEASCRLMQGRDAEALATIESIHFDGLDPPERADFAIAYAAIAIALRDGARLDDAATKLMAAAPARQYFAHENMKYQLAIERARAAIIAGTPVPKSSRLLDWMGSLSRWLIVQPNIAGIGINLNNMVDDAISARRRKRPDDKVGE